MVIISTEESRNTFIHVFLFLLLLLIMIIVVIIFNHLPIYLSIYLSIIRKKIIGDIRTYYISIFAAEYSHISSKVFLRNGSEHAPFMFTFLCGLLLFVVGVVVVVDDASDDILLSNSSSSSSSFSSISCSLLLHIVYASVCLHL